MAPNVRPRRSMLYMPGSEARKLEKARTLDADAFIFDLEDAVDPARKPEARDTVAAALAEGGYAPREVLVRINGLDTDWGVADLRMAARAGADGVLIPKVESPDTVRQVVRLLDQAGAPEGLGVWCMIETPRGVLDVRPIAESSSRLAGFVMGTADLAKDLHAFHPPDRLPMLTSLSLAVLAARANDLAVIDGVHLDLNDAEGFEQACLRGLEMGMDGKSLIHPKTVGTANRVFAPTEKEVAEARRVAEAWDQREEGAGVVVVDGRLVERLHAENARRIIALEDAIKALEREVLTRQGGAG